MDSQEQEIENKVEEIQEIGGMDIKLTPDFFIHKALNKIIDSFDNTSYSDGMQKMIVHINTLEIFAKSTGRIPTDYDEQIESFKKRQGYIGLNDISKKSMLSQFKLKLIMTAIGDNQIVTGELKI